MDSSSILGLIMLAVLALIWLLPLMTIVSSNKTTGGEKVAWLIAMFFISWFAWIFYILLAPIKKKKRGR